MDISLKLNKILHKVAKPARYTGGEWNSIVKDWETTPIRFALIYPDLYEIGMSNMALPILYELLNNQPDVLAERAFTPWPDMEALMRSEEIPLYSLESRHPLRDFNIIGFSLGYELTYTNVLNMLDLAGLPVLASERDESYPLIIAGGSCALNPEPMSDFIDLFVIGEGEEVLPELLDCYRKWKQTDQTARYEFLCKAATIHGIYVPGLYKVEYHANGLVKSINPVNDETPLVIQRRIVTKLPPPVTSPVVPYIEVVHDRGAVEIQRGCSHGCRFCQAGIIYRPVRERPSKEILNAIGEIIANCGYNEVSLVSLSTSDYPQIDELVNDIAYKYKNLNISLPSLYVNSFSVELVDSLPSAKKPGLTFAPEAGSERLRRIINKNVTEDELLELATTAFEKGWTGIKLYFMVGLPGETIEDIESLIKLVDEVRLLGKKTKGRTPQIRINVSTFVPKSHTPFQWVAQEDEQGLAIKHELLKQGLRRKGTKMSWQDPEVSLLEAVLSRGDRRLGKVIYSAWKLGSTFDSWDEYFNFRNWQQAFEEAGLDPGFYAHRQRSMDELLPWSHIETGVTTEFLKEEYQRALDGIRTDDCRTGNCNACGIERYYPICRQNKDKKT